MACKISLTAMFCSSCKEMRYSKAWSPLQWESWLTVLQAQDGERNCCRMCSNRFYQSTFPEVPPWKRYINPGDGNYWWHNSDTGEFFYEKTGTTAPPPQESGKCCSETPFTDIPDPGATEASEAPVFRGINDVTYDQFRIAVVRLREEIPPGFFLLIHDRMHEFGPNWKEQLKNISMKSLGFLCVGPVKFWTHFGAVRISPHGLSLTGLQKQVAHKDAAGVHYVDLGNATYRLVMDLVWEGHEMSGRSYEGQGDFIELMLGWAFLMRTRHPDKSARTEMICRYLEVVSFFVYRNFDHYLAYSAGRKAGRKV